MPARKKTRQSASSRSPARPRDTKASRAILERIRRSPHDRVKVAVCDVDGILRGKYVSREKFLSAVEKGFGFCDVVLGWDAADVCYDNVSFTGWHTGYPDAMVTLDGATYREIPWEDGQPFVLGQFVEKDGAPLPLCPRQLLQQVIARCKEAGYSPRIGMEFEWFNFQETPDSLAEKKYIDPKPLTPGMFGYSVLRASLSQPFLAQMMTDLAAFQIPIEGLHTETGPGVLEAAIEVGEALEAADRATLFKTSVKEIAYRHGIMASFMAKWNAKLPGCSGHVHQSLWDRAGKANLFYEEGASHSMSTVYRQYLAGQMHCVADILPMFAPTVNSYKRLVEGLWAPTRVTWGVENRTTAFRVIPGSRSSTRLETRVPGSDVNPYLAIAAALASGLYGVEHELSLSAQPVVGSAYLEKKATVLPRNLLDATRRMEQSKVARALFGDAFVDHFTATRHWEWRQYQDSVTDWEIQRYFEII